ncbi:ABC transporter ATP-binding protein [Curtobacterium sp. HSID17257]|nr:ABC transporter ATP-binding protein [Curtobacterium sp. HSID17257]
MAHKVNRDAGTGQFVSPSVAVRRPTTTTTERVGAGTSNDRPVYRSAATGEFVTAAFADRNPTRTIRQMV